MNDADKEALERAMRLARRDAFRSQQIDEMLNGLPDGRGGWHVKPRPWQEVAEFAAVYCQTEALNLAPWEVAPARADREVRNDGSFHAQSWSKAAYAPVDGCRP
jgi:hypothetical protein